MWKRSSGGSEVKRGESVDMGRGLGEIRRAVEVMLIVECLIRDWRRAYSSSQVKSLISQSPLKIKNSKFID